MDKQELITYFAADSYAQLTGVTIDDVPRPGVATAHMDVDGRHLNANGYCQGGALFTLADTIMAVAANSVTPGTVSIEVNIQYVRGVHAGRLEARAEPLAEHQRLPSYRVAMTQDGQTVCVATGIFYATKK